ncbi:hypothetical protein OQA88_7939 [Cercophora sp. LCS_1]
MKPAFALSLLSSLATTGLAAPTPGDGEFNVIRLNATELISSGPVSPPALDRRQSGNPNYAGTLQAWRWVSNCGGAPDYTWYPVSWNGPFTLGQNCYEFWEGGQRRDVYSLYLTGDWGLCSVQGHANAGCSGSPDAVGGVYVCANRGGGSIKSFQVVCR